MHFQKGEGMEDEKKGYTFTDRRGADKGGANRQHEGPESQEDTRKSASHEQLPKVDFSTLIMSLASAAMISIGRIPDPITGEINKNLALAQQNIDIISMLKEKTKGNLTTEEENLVENILFELRMHYIESEKGEK